LIITFQYIRTILAGPSVSQRETVWEADVMERTPLVVLAVATAQAFIEYVIWKLFRLPPITRRQRVYMFLAWAVAYTAWYVYQNGWTQVLDFQAGLQALFTLAVMALVVWSLAYAPHSETRRTTDR
jgi:hypothetical protein